MKIVKRFSVLLILFILLASFKWISITELNEQYKIQPKPILIDVYTNWCGWCRVMEKETYSQESVSSYINDNYYAVKFDAETTDSVEFNGRKFGYNTSYKANELAIYLLDGRMGYPTTILLSSINAQPAPLSGFLKPSELEPPLKFFAEGAYKKKEFPEYMKDFTAKW
jgi:thioredoxin-related protein